MRYTPKLLGGDAAFIDSEIGGTSQKLCQTPGPGLHPAPLRPCLLGSVRGTGRLRVPPLWRGGLFAAFHPDQTRRIIQRLEIHHTPIHASWLNLEEIEIAHEKEGEYIMLCHLQPYSLETIGENRPCRMPPKKAGRHFEFLDRILTFARYA